MPPRFTHISASAAERRSLAHSAVFPDTANKDHGHRYTTSTEFINSLFYYANGTKQDGVDSEAQLRRRSAR